MPNRSNSSPNLCFEIYTVCRRAYKLHLASDVLGRHMRQHTQNSIGTLAEITIGGGQEEQQSLTQRSSISSGENAARSGQDADVFSSHVDEHMPSPNFNLQSSQDSLREFNYYNNLTTPIQTPDYSTEILTQHDGEGVVLGISISMSDAREPAIESPSDETRAWNHEAQVQQAQNESRTEYLYRTNDVGSVSLGISTPGWQPPHEDFTNIHRYCLADQENLLDPRLTDTSSQDNSITNDVLQTWLNHLQDEAPAPNPPMFQDTSALYFNIADGPSHVAVDSTSTNSISENDQIPNERFARVEKCWPVRCFHGIRLISKLWRSVVFEAEGNLFCGCANIKDASASLPSGSRWGLDEQCRDRLRSALPSPDQNSNHSLSSIDQADVGSPVQNLSATGSSVEQFITPQSFDFPPAEILDIGLDLYIHQFHPLLPLIHIPTFSAKTMPSLMLLVMCLIGLNILNTKGSKRFVRKCFPVSY